MNPRFAGFAREELTTLLHALWPIMDKETEDGEDFGPVHRLIAEIEDERIHNAETVRVSKADLRTLIDAADSEVHYTNRVWRIRQRLFKAAHLDGTNDA